MVEQRYRKPQVGGSIPFAGSSGGKMHRQKTMKFDVLNVRIEGGVEKQEIRVSTTGPLQLTATLRDGTVLKGTNVVVNHIVGISKLTWDKMLVVVVCSDTTWRNQGKVSLNLAWAVRYRAQAPGGSYVWRMDSKDEGRIDHHHCVYASGSGDNFTIVPWSEEGEAFLTAASDSIVAFGKKIENFFAGSEQLSRRIAEYNGGLLLPESKP
jgi:hypothetical protein